MLGKQTDLLKALIGAANGWRDATVAAGAELTQVNVLFPDGKAVTLFYNDEAGDWEVNV